MAAIDVEWSKNYRIRGGNVPFCYSVAWLTVPNGGASLDKAPFRYTSAYVHRAAETQNLIAGAGCALASVLRQADLIAGTSSAATSPCWPPPDRQ